MIAEKLLYRVGPDNASHPQRCQGTIAGKGGQCEYYSMSWLAENGHISEADREACESLTCCPRHGGFNQLRTTKKASASAYRIQVWQERIDEFSDETITNLRGEIGICRMMLEEVLNLCQGNTGQLIIHSQRVMQLVDRIEKLVRSCHQIETKSGMMMDKTAALSFASDAVRTISEHINDPEILDRISNGLIDSLKKYT